MVASSHGLGRAEILALLNEVGCEAERREVSVSIFLVGGAAMALAYSTTRATKDLDGVFEPKQVVYEIAAGIARDHPEYGLSDDWLNDAAKSFLPGDDALASTLFELPALSVRVASPRYLFVMKAMAAREVDEEDLRILYPLCHFESAAEALNALEAAYPGRPMEAAVQYLLEGIAAEFDGP